MPCLWVVEPLSMTYLSTFYVRLMLLKSLSIGSVEVVVDMEVEEIITSGTISSDKIKATCYLFHDKDE